MDSATPSVAMLCEHVFTGDRPILLVIHQRLWWQVLCGADDHTGRPRRAHMHHVASRVPDLELERVPLGFEASRASAASPWIVARSEETDIGDSDAAAFVEALQARRGKPT